MKTSGRLPVIFLLSAFLVVTGCAVTPQASVAHLENDVRAFEAEVMNSYNGEDPTRAASFYAEDAFVHVPGQRHAEGREAIAANIAHYMQDPHFSLGYVNELTRISASGDLLIRAAS